MTDRDTECPACCGRLSANSVLDGDANLTQLCDPHSAHVGGLLGRDCA